MTDKLTDNEIIKVLECCVGDAEGKNCFDCPLYEIDDCQAHMYLDALDLINRLQAELKVSNEALNNSIKLNNRLETQNKDLAETVHNLTLEKDALFDKAEELKAEVERLKDEICIQYKIIDERGAEVFRQDRCIRTLHEKLEIDKAEAYKECIEKVEEIICDNTYPDFDVNHKAVNIWKAEAYKDINNLLKEMVGEDK